jgi:hypothetical protein
MTNASASFLRRIEGTNCRSAQSDLGGFPETGAFAPQMAAYLGKGERHAVQAQTLRNPKLVVTGLQCEGGLFELSASIPAGEGVHRLSPTERTPVP